MNTNETILAELREIANLVLDTAIIATTISEFEHKASEDRQKLKNRLISTISQNLKKFQAEQLKQLPKWPGVGYKKGTLKNYPPMHWAYDTSMPELKEEEALESWFSVEEKEQFYSTFREYDKSFIKILKTCEKKAKEEWTIYDSELSAFEKNYVEEKKKLEDKQIALSRELYKHTVIDSSLFQIAGDIYTILKLKRADTLKEAINLALDDKRKEAEDAQRALHNAEMERLAEERVSAARAQAHAVERQNAENRRAQEEAKVAAFKRCMHCAYTDRCSSTVKSNAVNCTSYVPK